MLTATCTASGRNKSIGQAETTDQKSEQADLSFEAPPEFFFCSSAAAAVSFPRGSAGSSAAGYRLVLPLIRIAAKPPTRICSPLLSLRITARISEGRPMASPCTNLHLSPLSRPLRIR